MPVPNLFKHSSDQSVADPPKMENSRKNSGSSVSTKSSKSSGSNSSTSPQHMFALQIGTQVDSGCKKNEGVLSISGVMRQRWNEKVLRQLPLVDIADA